MGAPKGRFLLLENTKWGFLLMDWIQSQHKCFLPTCGRTCQPSMGPTNVNVFQLWRNYKMIQISIARGRWCCPISLTHLIATSFFTIRYEASVHVCVLSFCLDVACSLLSPSFAIRFSLLANSTFYIIYIL